MSIRKFFQMLSGGQPGAPAAAAPRAETRKGRQADMPPLTEDQQQSVKIAKRGANEAMAFYKAFLAHYDDPPTPDIWRSDFALGFMFRIADLHFLEFRPELRDSPRASALKVFWRRIMMGADTDLEDAFIRKMNSGSDIRVAQLGMRSASLMEAWRLKVETVPGALGIVDGFKERFLEHNPGTSPDDLELEFACNWFVLPMTHIEIFLLQEDHRDAQEQRQKQLDGLINEAWERATLVMETFFSIRQNCDLPLGLEMWRDDFMIGFRDGISHAIFSHGDLEIPAIVQAEMRWRLHILGDDQTREEMGTRRGITTGELSERYHTGYVTAVMLESVRQDQDLKYWVAGKRRALEEQIRHELPGASSKAVRHELYTRLIESQFIPPLLAAKT